MAVACPYTDLNLCFWRISLPTTHYHDLSNILYLPNGQSPRLEHPHFGDSCIEDGLARPNHLNTSILCRSRLGTV